MIGVNCISKYAVLRCHPYRRTLAIVALAAAAVLLLQLAPPWRNAAPRLALAAAPTNGLGSCGMSTSQKPPDCERVDNGSCGTACCTAEVELQAKLSGNKAFIAKFS